MILSKICFSNNSVKRQLTIKMYPVYFRAHFLLWTIFLFFISIISKVINFRCFAIRGASGCSRKIVDVAINGCNYLCNMNSDALIAEFSNRLAAVNCAALPKDKILSELKAAASDLRDPAAQFASEHKRKTFFTQNNSFIEPEELTIGSRFERVKSQSLNATRYKRIFNTFQYVAIDRTLKSVLNKQPLQDELQFVPNFNCDLMSSALHGARAKRICDAIGTRKVLFLEIFYDEFETANAIGTKAGVHKLGAFYYVIKNLPHYLNSSMPNIYRIFRTVHFKF